MNRTAYIQDNAVRRYTGIVVVDLDGTLVCGNTWRFFARFLLRHALRRGRVVTVVCLAAMLLLRRLRLISHAEVKRRFMLRSRMLSPRDLDIFADAMAERFDADVLAEVRRQERGGAMPLLATAAAGEYAPLIARRAGISHVVCTQPAAAQGRIYAEARGARKADLVWQFARRHALPVVMVITDHPDDMPLFERFSDARHIFVGQDAALR